MENQPNDITLKEHSTVFSVQLKQKRSTGKLFKLFSVNFHFCPDLDRKQIIPDSGKSSGSRFTELCGGVLWCLGARMRTGQSVGGTLRMRCGQAAQRGWRRNTAPSCLGQEKQIYEK